MVDGSRTTASQCRHHSFHLVDLGGIFPLLVDLSHRLLRRQRLGRSLQHLVGFLEDVHALGIDLYLDCQEVDTTTPAGKALFQMLGVFSEFERAMIRERVKAGLARARAQGKVIGRPKVNGGVERKVRQLRAQGMGIKRIAKEAGVAVATVYRILNATAPT